MNLKEKVFRHMLTKNHSVQQNLESGPINRFITIEIGRVKCQGSMDRSAKLHRTT